MTQGRVDSIYGRLKQVLVGFDIRPGERLNEVALAREMGVSRTPLREALNRLAAERLIEFRAGSGFYCRALEAQGIYDLYELRRIIETSAVMLAAARASEAELVALADETIRTGLDVTGMTVAEATDRDEAFHLGIARLSGNVEIVAQLRAISERIRFIRWVNMSKHVAASKQEHRRILEALLRRDGDRAGEIMAEHISRRMDQVVAAVKEGLSSIYMEGPAALTSQVIGEEA